MSRVYYNIECQDDLNKFLIKSVVGSIILEE